MVMEVGLYKMDFIQHTAMLIVTGDLGQTKHSLMDKC